MIYSAFNYGHTITKENKYFPIDEGSGVIPVELRVRSYSLGDFVVELNRALNAFGDNDYQVQLDRATGKITISSADPFELLLNPLSSDFAVVSCFELVGFTTAIDLEAVSDDEMVPTYSLTGDSISGSVFYPQFELQGYIDFDNSQRAANAAVNESASGKVEVVKFGNVKIMTCNVTMQTNNTMVNNCASQSPIKPDPNGVNNLRDFMLYATTKAPLEFVRDVSSNANILTPVKCILESTTESSDGVGFELIELYSRGLVGYYETGTISFREIR